MKKLLAVILCTVLGCMTFGLISQAQEPTAQKFVALGDSITEGVGAINKENAYVNRVAKAKGYELRNFGKGGDTSATLLRKVTEDESIRQAIRRADVIALTIGGNDFYPTLDLILSGLLGDYSWMKPRHDAFRTHFSGIIAEIHALNPDAVLVVQTLYNPIFALMLPSMQTAYEAVVQGINAVIHEYLAKNPGVYRIADTYAAFQQRYGMVYIDMVHPSDCGHAVIAEVVLSAIDNTQPPPPPANDALDFTVSLAQPVLSLIDQGIISALIFVRDRLPSVWAMLMQL